MHLSPSLRTRANLPLLVSGLGLMALGFILLLQKPTIELTPTRTGKSERCLTCHNGIEAISASHSTKEFGCVSCHEGVAMATDAGTAHTGLVSNPSALSVAATYCGECHTAQVFLVQHSIMTTYSGAISLVRRAFGLQPDGTALFAATAVDHLKGFVPAPSYPQPVQQFAANCLNCHTDAQSKAADYFYRSTGCASCHVLYSETGRYEGGDPTTSKTEQGHAQQHQFTTSIPYTQCNHCHNRGNYDLRSMTFVDRPDIPATNSLGGQAKRLHDYYQPIGEFTRCEWELECIDCHTSLEIMGDGILHNNRTEAQYIQCSTCHGTLDTLPAEQTIQYTTEIGMTRANLNTFVDLQVGDTIMVTQRGEPLYNIQKTDNQWTYTSKVDGTRYVLPLVTGSKCQQKPDEQASRYCHQCHSYNREGSTP